MLSSILSYPERGPWGDASYPGNCSGHIIKRLLEYYEPRIFVDPAEGSGTSRDVAKELGLTYFGFDLRSGFDVLTQPLDAVLCERADLVFFHPPYHNIVRYSSQVWGKEPHPQDLSQCPTFEDYLFKLKLACINIWSAIRQGGRLAVLIGDTRRNGTYYSPQAQVQQFHLGQLEAILIKAQHHTRSANKKYYGRFIPIAHEYLLVFRKK